MTEKELKKLSRRDLLYMLVSQGKELQKLKADYEKAQAALQDRSIGLEKAGSIAQASLQVNGVFEAAEAACRQYTENIERISRQQAEQIIKEAQKESEALRKDTEAQCAEMLKTARNEAKTYHDTMVKKVTDFLEENKELKEKFLNRAEQK